MRYTSSEANKLLRRLTEERDALLVKELKSSTFLAAMGEDVDSVRPDYDYAQTQKELEELDRKIRMVKHAINGFNVSHEVQGFDMTIDQMLVYIPQLTSKKKKLSNMKSRLPKQREMPVDLAIQAVLLTTAMPTTTSGRRKQTMRQYPMNLPGHRRLWML